MSTPMRWSRGVLLFALADLAMVALAWWAAFWLRFNFEMPQEYLSLAFRTMPWGVLCMALGLGLAQVQRQAWRYVGLADLRHLAWGVLLGTLAATASIMALRYEGFARSVLPLFGVLTLVLLAGSRAAWRTLAERHALRQRPPGHTPLLIVGTLEEADQALRTLKGVPGWHVAGIVSPRGEDAGRSLQNVAVVGGSDALGSVAEALGVRSVLVASPPGSALRREVLLRWSGTGLNVLSMPVADHWLSASTTDLRQVQLEDLLGRAPVVLDARDLAEWLSGQTVLVSGAGGSIGAELCRQVARLGVARLVCVDASEAAIYELAQELRAVHPHLQGHYYTANVREPDRMAAIASRHRPAVVFHAAAYKHVPLMEELNEIEALHTNVLGTLHLARAAGECGAARFVLVSTDKAVNPTNVMGASKRLAERVVQAVAAQHPGTQYVAVRFGNVLGSSGSVVPLFSAQIARGGPVTVTHPEIVRYFMTIPEAAQLVVQAGWMGRSGQIYVLDMGEPVRIVELARLLIRLSGKTEAEVPIAFTGLRPGEKLFEEWLANGETTEPTAHPRLRMVREGGLPLLADLQALEHWVHGLGPAPEPQELRQGLRERVPEYTPRY
ncbi:nucleoside-diphosphate sugar epimerase/dehydratase [Pulveribacter sp.]|uniref:polysaccharide biosynthesis protein n=1 Tax=Pulveribacter sp. TaxID=2678893 RepID=UPI0028A900A1|nr:nucleoside-diphosphate sugar epimerase/dehydratase [Pulveribacter sp.]